MEDRRRRRVPFEKTELQEPLEISEEAGVSITHVTQQAMNENGQTIFEMFRQGEEEVYEKPVWPGGTRS